MLNPTGPSEKLPLPEPMFVALHVAVIENDELLADTGVAALPLRYFTRVTLTVCAPLQGPVRFDEVSHGVKVTVLEAFILSPEPGPTNPGPFAAPHQLQVASTDAVPAEMLPSPYSLFPEMALRFTRVVLFAPRP